MNVHAVKRRKAKRAVNNSSLRWSFGRRPRFELLEERRLLAVTWDGGAGTFNWNDAANWSTNALPGATDDVVIPDLAGTPTITFSSGTASVHSLVSEELISISGGTLGVETDSSLNAGLTLSGTLSGSGTVNVSGALNWTSGTMQGTGQTIVAAGGTLNLSGSTHTLSRTLVNDGTATWTGGDLAMTNGTLINNGSFTANPSNSTLLYCYGPTGSVNAFQNAGTFIKQGTGTTNFGGFSGGQIGVPFNNSGSVDVQQGTLQLRGGAISGSMVAEPSGTLYFWDGDYTYVAGTSVSGAGTFSFSSSTHTFLAGQFNPTGTVNFQSGTVTVNNSFTPSALGTISGTVLFNAPQTFDNLTLTGTLSGSGNVTVTGTLNWTGGEMSGTGQTIVAAGGTLNLSGIPNGLSLKRTLVNDGTAWWTSNHLLMTNGTFVNNGTFTANPSNSTLLYCYGPTSSVNAFQNAGTFIKQGTGTTNFGGFSGFQIPVPFNNTGSVDVQQGTLQLFGGGTSSAIEVDAGSTLLFGNDYTYAAGASLSGAGTLTLSNGTHTFLAGQFNPTGTVNFSGATVTVNNSFTTAALVTIGGRVNFNAPQSFNDVTLTGTLSGSGNVTVTRTLNWTGGEMSGTGQTILAAGGTLNLTGSPSGSTYYKLSRTLVNDGTVLWTDGDLFLTNGTFVNNGTFTANKSNSTLYCYGLTGNVNAFNNAGTFIKQGTGSTNFGGGGSGGGTIAVPFNNSGSVDVQQGTLTISNSLMLDGSTILKSQPDASLIINGHLTGNTTNAGQFDPQGTIVLNGPGSAGAPELLEVMGRDLGNTPEGFAKNFVYGTLSLASSTYVKLVDQADNAIGLGAEALYVNRLIVPSGTTLNLNSLNVYARAVQINGTVTGGVINLAPDGGPLSLDNFVSGKVAVVDEADDWTFYGRSGQGVAVVLNPGTGALSPQLGFGQIELLSPTNESLGIASNLSSGQVVSLTGITLPSDGTYRVRVSAAPANSASTGNYNLSVYDATIDELPIAFNQQYNGTIESPYSVDRWMFHANAGQQIRFDFLNANSPSIYFQLTGPDGYTAFSGLSGDSALITLPSTGQYVLTADAFFGQPGHYAFRMQETTQTELALGTTVTGSIVGSASAQLFKVTLAEAKKLLILLDDATNSDRNEVYVKFGAPPTRSDYHYKFDTPASADQQLLVSAGLAGDWYILLYGDYVPNPSSFTLVVSDGELFVSHVTPNSTVTSAGLTMTITGAGFDAATVVKLLDANNVVYLPATTQVDLPTQITITFAAGALPTGTYSLQLDKPGGISAAVPNVLAVSAVGEAKLETKLVLPGWLGRHVTATLYIEYANNGSVAMPAPLIQLGSADPDRSDKPLLTLDQSKVIEGYWSSVKPEGFDTSVTILASGAQPGVLNPGERVRVPVYYIGLLQPWDFTDTQVELGLTVIEATDQRPMNWEGMTYVFLKRLRLAGWGDVQGGAGAVSIASGAQTISATAVPWINELPPSDEQLKNTYGGYRIERISDEPGVLQLRPPTIDAATWSVIVGNLKAQVGNSLGDWVKVLDENAKYLSRQGIVANDISELWSFEVLQAMGLGPQRVLDSAVDAAVVAPGVELSLSRSFVNTISGRYRSGPFGYGWALNWDSHLTEAADGAVTISYGGDATTRYEPDSRSIGKYFSPTGDTSVLTKLVSGEFDLRSADGVVTQYDANGVLQYVRDPNGNQVTTGYTAGRLTSLTHSSGQSLSIHYNAAGVIDQVTDSAGRVTTYTYDATNQYLLSVTTDDGKVTHYTYQTSGSAAKLHALTSIEVGGTTEYFTYDTFGRLDTSYLTGNTEFVDYGYNDTGEVTANDGFGTTTLYFDQRGLLVKTKDALGNITSAQFDDNARLKKLVAPTGESQFFQWSSQGNLTNFTDELGQTTTFAYNNPYNLLTSFTDARDNTTRYNYDAVGNLLSIAYPNNAADVYGDYTLTGLPQTFTNRRNQTATYEYYDSGQIKQQTLADGSHNDFTYDARGNLLTVSENPAAGPAKVTTYSYSYATDGDRLKQVTYSDGRFLAFAYDTFGRRQSITDQDGYTTKYEYDAAGRLHILRDAANAILVTYTYDPAGRLSRIDKGNGTITTYDYDAAGQILHLVNHGDAQTINSRFDYTYDSRGRRTSMTTLDGAWTYTYDPTGQLTGAVFASANTAIIPDQDLQYFYDAAGNRTKTIINGVATDYVTNNLNEYTSVGGVNYTYDADGNLTFDGSNTYTYDQQNRLVMVSGPSGVTQYEYDALGNRTASIINGQRTEYLLDPTGLVNVTAEYDGSGSLMAHNVYGLGLVGRTQGAGPLNYYSFDALGSTADITGTAGAILSQYAYLPFGGELLGSSVILNPFQFMGAFGVTTDDPGRISTRVREYSPTLGTFLSRDPLALGGGDPNFTRYSINNPIQYVDPSGLDSAAERAKETKALADSIVISIGTVEAFDGLIITTITNLFTVPIVNTSTFLINHLLIVPANYWFNLSLTPGQYVSFQPYHFHIPQLPSPDPDSVKNIQSRDPNDKISGAGVGSFGYIQNNTTIPYRVDFENVGPGSVNPATGLAYASYATAPAQRVEITDQLANNLDWSTLRFTEAGFGDTVLVVSDDSTYYSAVVPMTYNGRTFDVEVELSFDLASGILRAVFQSIDPNTFLPPDVLTGFLPPEDGTGRGKGFIGFTVHPIAGLTTGTEIKNVALISFDRQTIIATNQADPFDPTSAVTDPNHTDYGKLNARNTIDITPPTSAVDPLPPLMTSNNLTLSWGGADVGAGIATYDIYVSINGASFEPLLVNTSLTSSDFTLASGNTFSFYSVAVDQVGNREIGAPVVRTTTVELSVGDYNGDGYVEQGDIDVWRASYGQTGTGLTADGNQDGVIDASDYVIARKNLFRIVHDPLGDYNTDGRIDKLDYNVWRASYGLTGNNLPADGNQDGVVDALDYLIWRKLDRSIVVLPAGGSTVAGGAYDPNLAVPTAESGGSVELAAVAAESLAVSAAAPVLVTSQSIAEWAASDLDTFDFERQPVRDAEAIHAEHLFSAVDPWQGQLRFNRAGYATKKNEPKNRALHHFEARSNNLLAYRAAFADREGEDISSCDAFEIHEYDDSPVDSVISASDDVFELLGSHAV